MIVNIQFTHVIKQKAILIGRKQLIFCEIRTKSSIEVYKDKNLDPQAITDILATPLPPSQTVSDIAMETPLNCRYLCFVLLSRSR